MDLPGSVEQPVDFGKEAEEVRASVNVDRRRGLVGPELLAVLHPLDFVQEFVGDDDVEEVPDSESHLLRRHWLLPHFKHLPMNIMDLVI